MYSNLTLYYLHQLGITPWIRKPNVPAKSVFALFKNESLQGKADALLNKIVAFLGFNTNEFITLVIKDNDFISAKQQCSLLFKDKQIIASVFAGVDNKEFIDSLPLNPGAGLNISPDLLLKNPLLKKKMFMELMTLRNKISQ